MSRRLVALPVLLCFVGLCSEARGQSVGSEYRCGPAEKPDQWPDYGGTPDITLSPELGMSVQEVEEALASVVAADFATRVEAAAQIARDATGSEQSFREVLWSNHGARNTEIKTAMKEARRRMDRKGDDAEGGLLGALLEMDPNDTETGAGTRAATRVMTLLVALSKLNTMAGYKVMLDFSLRHAGAFRREIGDMLVSVGFDALPALVYGRGSKDQELHMFAVKWIRDMGNPLLGEQITGIENPRRLAQLLEAYASVREMDAVDVTVSLTNHDSIFVRNAARKCLEVYGANAKWQIRRTYENTFSREPSAESSFEQWRAEIYRHYDQARIAPEMGLFEQGLDLARSGDLEGMAARYAEVLRNEPMFPRRHEMAAGFIELAALRERQERLDGAREATLLALRVARHGSEEHGRAQARLKWIEAEVNRKAGAVDPVLYARIAEMDPDHGEAASLAQELAIDDPRLRNLGRKAVLISLFVFLTAILVIRRIGMLGRRRGGGARE
jgi:hypothetical protein